MVRQKGILRPLTVESLCPAILHFGTFEVDVRARELLKQGKRIRLQDQPFQLLNALLQRPGDLVTREELRARLWPEGTFVDFNNGLNTATNKLRRALHDSAGNPPFIETLPRRGYRFIAPVRRASLRKPFFTAANWRVAWLLAVAALAAAVIARRFL